MKADPKQIAGYLRGLADEIERLDHDQWRIVTANKMGHREISGGPAYGDMVVDAMATGVSAICIAVVHRGYFGNIEADLERAAKIIAPTISHDGRVKT